MNNEQKHIIIKSVKNRREVLKTRHIKFVGYTFSTENKDKLIKLIKDNLTIDLLSKEYKKQALRGEAAHRFSGFCVVANEALQMLMNVELTLWSGVFGDEKHYFLKHGQDIIDITGSQYDGFDYEIAKKAERYSFMRQYQQRSANLAIRVLRDDGRQVEDDLVRGDDLSTG